MGDGGLEILGHAHRKGVDARVLLRKLGEQSLHAPHLRGQNRLVAGVLRDRHQATQHQSLALVNQGGQPENLLLRRTGFAALSANIDLQTDI